MPLERVLEPEVMDTKEEAVSYDSMDHSEVNRKFVADMIAAFEPGLPLERALDLGTGTALIPIEFCNQHERISIVGTDLAESMLEVGRQNVDQARLGERIALQLCDSKSLPFEDHEFQVVMSNSIVHHIPEPASVLGEAVRVAQSAIFFRDLMRPKSDDEVKRLVELYAGEESDHAKAMFDDSLRAALSLDEIRALVANLGLDPEDVSASTDRHWTWVTKL